MTKFYDWIMENTDKDTALGGLALVMKEHPEKIWNYSTDYKRMKKKFISLDLSDVFEEAYKMYMEDISAPCKHDKNNECFWMKLEIASKPLSATGKAPRGYRIGGVKQVMTN